MNVTTEESIISLLRITYQSCNTQQITVAHHSLLNYMLANTPQSFTQLEKLLASTHPDIDYNCKKAIANLVRVSGREILKILCEISKEEQQTQRYKKLMFVAQHMFDNLKIPSNFKLQIGEVYVSLFNFYTPDNNNRLIGKCRYFFNIKEEIQAMALIQVYHHGSAPFKFRGAFYHAALQTLIENLNKKVSNTLKETNGGTISEIDNQIIFKYLQITRQIWLDQTFQKYQSAFTNVLGKSPFSEVIHIFTSHRWPRQLTSQIYDILASTTNSLGRCNLFPKYKTLTELLEQIGKKILAQHLFIESQQSDNECMSELNFITAVIDYKIVSCDLNCLNLFSQIIYPNYKCIQKYLSHHAENQQQIFNFLEDCAFEMESACVPTKRNKLLATLCRSSTECASSLRSIIYSFLYSHLPKISGGDVSVVSVNYCLRSGEEMWAFVNQKIDSVEQSKCILLVTALQVGIFMSDRPFLSYVQKFVELNFSFLLEKNNQIIFYAILLYRNYMDDVFSTVGCVSFKIRLMRHILNQQSSLIKHFAIQVLKQQISMQIPFNAVQYQVSQIMNVMSTDFTDSLLPLTILIFKEYGMQLKHQQAITIVSTCFQLWISKRGNVEYLGLQLLSHFFGIQSCADQFDSFMVNLLIIANEQLPLIQKYSDQFLEILSKGLKKTGYLPKDFQSTVMKLKLQIKNNQIMESLNSLIAYSQHELFFNWLCELITKSELNTRSTLLLHSLIYFGYPHLSINNIRNIIAVTYVSRIMADSHFNYHNGKLNLIFVLLFRYRGEDINRLLIEDDWNYVHEEVNTKKEMQNILTKETWRGRSSFVDEIYQLVYRAQSAYRWKYDIQIFLINQIWLLRHKLTDNLQMRYANLSFVACLTNIIRAFEMLRSANEGSDCDSDDSLHRKTEVQKNCHAAKKILSHYTVPSEFAKANYLKQFQQLVAYLKQDEDSRKWLETLLSKVLQNSKMQVYHQIIELQNIQGNFRKIRRLKHQSPNS